MDAKKCDRCGKYYIPENSNQKYLLCRRGLHCPIAFDLCNDCYDLLVKFYKNESITNVEEDVNHAEEG